MEMFAAVFLMKALSHGAVAEKEPAVLELQHQILTCFREAAVDDEHIASEIAKLLERVFPALPALPTLPNPTLPPMPSVADSAGTGLSTENPGQTGTGFDTGVPDDNRLQPDDQTDVFANWGFDPVLILNEMDAFIQNLDKPAVETHVGWK